MTPEEIAKTIVENRFHGAPYMSAYAAPDLIADVAAALRACAAQERERCAQIALELGWRADASDAMRVAATSIAAALRALPTTIPEHE